MPVGFAMPSETSFGVVESNGAAGGSLRAGAVSTNASEGLRTTNASPLDHCVLTRRMPVPKSA